MAAITVSVSTVTGSTPNVNNTKAAAIIADFILAEGGPVNGTSREKLDWVALALAKYMRQRANQAGISARVNAEEAAAKAELETRDWI